MTSKQHDLKRLPYYCHNHTAIHSPARTLHHAVSADLFADRGMRLVLLFHARGVVDCQRRFAAAEHKLSQHLALEHNLSLDSDV
jgi:hypothetical protein